MIFQAQRKHREQKRIYNLSNQNLATMLGRNPSQNYRHGGKWRAHDKWSVLAWKFPYLYAKHTPSKTGARATCIFKRFTYAKTCLSSMRGFLAGFWNLHVQVCTSDAELGKQQGILWGVRSVFPFADRLCSTTQRLPLRTPSSLEYHTWESNVSIITEDVAIQVVIMRLIKHEGPSDRTLCHLGPY